MDQAVSQRKLDLSHIAHDLRAPLSIAITTLHLLQDGTLGDLNGEQTDWVATALDSLRYASQLVGDVFDLAKIENGGLTLYVENIDLADFLRNIHHTAGGLPHDPAVSIQLDLPADLPVIVGDSIRLRQVFMNLLSNAVKYTVQGSITIYARHLPQRQEVLLGVADTGEGIPPDKLGELFQPFHQVDTNLVRRRTGDGAGPGNLPYPGRDARRQNLG